MKKLHKISQDRAVGLVLCGGKSRRMERDKGLLELEASQKTWAETSAHLLDALVGSCFYSLREEQFGLYEKKIPALEKENCIFDEDIAAGPLRGILSAWHKLQSELVVLPADMPDLPQKMLQKLLDACQEQNGGFSVACFVTPLAETGKPEIHPFPSFWKKNLLEQIYKQAIEGNLKNFSIIGFIKKSQALFIELPVEKRRLLQSKNRPEDL